MNEPTSQQRTLPPPVEANMLRLLCTYLLFERQQETEVRTMAEGLITERHTNFHAENNPDWRQCRNQVCVNAALIIDNAKRQEIALNEFSIQLMAEYTIQFQPVGDGKGGLRHIRARLMRKEDVLKAQQAAAAKEPGRIVMP